MLPSLLSNQHLTSLFRISAAVTVQFFMSCTALAAFFHTQKKPLKSANSAPEALSLNAPYDAKLTFPIFSDDNLRL